MSKKLQDIDMQENVVIAIRNVHSNVELEPAVEHRLTQHLEETQAISKNFRKPRTKLALII